MTERRRLEPLRLDAPTPAPPAAHQVAPPPGGPQRPKGSGTHWSPLIVALLVGSVSILALAGVGAVYLLRERDHEAPPAASRSPSRALVPMAANDGADATRPVLPPVDVGFVDKRGGWGWGDRCWNSIHAKKWGWAKAECDEGMKMNPGSPQPRASLLYNEGLVAQGAGNVEEARSYFTQSLALREHPDVRAALDSLGPAAPLHRSTYGRVETVVEPAAAGSSGNARCHVLFVRGSSARTLLFDVPDCVGDTPGMNMIATVDHLGTLTFPVQLADGDEVHLFAIASARGGNAVPWSDYWVAVVRADTVWATTAPFAMTTLTTARITSRDGLVLEAAPTTTSTGARYSVTYGHVSNSDLAIVPSKVVSTATRELAGTIEPGYRANGFRKSVQGVQIDEDGPCHLEELSQLGGQVRVNVFVTTWSDGRTAVACLSVR